MYNGSFIHYSFIIHNLINIIIDLFAAGAVSTETSLEVEESTRSFVGVNRKNNSSTWQQASAASKPKTWRNAFRQLGFVDTRPEDDGNNNQIRNLIKKREQYTNPFTCLQRQTSMDAKYNAGRKWNRIILPCFNVSFALEGTERRYLQFVSRQIQGTLLLLNGLAALMKSLLLLVLAARVGLRADWAGVTFLSSLVATHLTICFATRFTLNAFNLTLATWCLFLTDVLTPMALQDINEVSETYAMCQVLIMIFVTYTLMTSTLKVGFCLATIASCLYLAVLVTLMAESLLDGAVRKVTLCVSACLRPCDTGLHSSIFHNNSRQQNIVRYIKLIGSLA